MNKINTICLVLIVVLLGIIAWENRYTPLSDGVVDNLLQRRLGSKWIDLRLESLPTSTPAPTSSTKKWIEERMKK